MIRREILESMGIEIPEDASRFYTENASIVFLVPWVEEYGGRIVFNEEEIEVDLTEAQAESLRAANCFGATGWTIV
jgi:hypothetical protein